VGNLYVKRQSDRAVIGRPAPAAGEGLVGHRPKRRPPLPNPLAVERTVSVILRTGGDARWLSLA